MSPRKFDQKKADHVLAVMDRMQGAPFLTTIADMAEIGEAKLKQWVRYGLELRDHGQEDDPQAIWASTFRRRQAEWMDKATRFAEENTHDKERAAAVKSVQWTLERLRRDTFDLSRAPKEAPKGDSNKPDHVVKTAKQAADELGKTGLQ